MVIVKEYSLLPIILLQNHQSSPKWLQVRFDFRKTSFALHIANSYWLPLLNTCLELMFASQFTKCIWLWSTYAGQIKMLLRSMWDFSQEYLLHTGKTVEVRDKAEIDSIVQHFRTILRADIKMSDEDLKSMVYELATLNAEMSKAKDYMDSAKVALLSAHGTTLEYLGQTSEVKLNKQCHRQGERAAMCLFCTLKFSDAGTRKWHILQTHYHEAKALVSINSLYCRWKGKLLVLWHMELSTTLGFFPVYPKYM